MPAVLLISNQFAPVAEPGTLRPIALARYLPEHGYDVAVAANDVPPPGRLATQQRIEEGILDTLPSSVAIHRGFPGQVEYGRGGGEAIEVAGSRWVSFSLARDLLVGMAKRFFIGGPHVRADYCRLRFSAISAIQRYRCQLVVATGPPFVAVTVGAAAARASGLPFIGDVRDPWSYGALWNCRTPEQKAEHQASEPHILRQAARMVYTSPQMRDNVAAAYPQYAEKLRFILNGFDTQSTPATRVRQDRLVVTFTGTLYSYRDPGVVLKALDILERQAPEEAAYLLVRFVGDQGIHKERLQDYRGRAIVEAVPPVDVETSRKMMQDSDVLLLLQTIEGSGADVISGKVYEYLAAGRPILGVVPPGGGDEWLLKQANVGPIHGIHDPEPIARSLISLVKQWQADQLTATIDPAWLAQFHRREVARRYAELFDEVLAEPSNAPTRR